jgi:hypothetical protein
MYKFRVYLKSDLENGGYDAVTVFNSGHNAYNYAYKLSRSGDVIVYKTDPRTFDAFNRTGIIKRSFISYGSYDASKDDVSEYTYLNQYATQDNEHKNDEPSVIWACVIGAILICAVSVYLSPSLPLGISSSVEMSDIEIGIPDIDIPTIEAPDIDVPKCVDDFIYTHQPMKGSAYIIGGDGHDIKLIDNKDAHDPTYHELINFIIMDDTDKHKYIPNEYVCADFAETLHNNAESNGIKAGWVNVYFNDNDDHACNVFNTTDMGIVYIDCTSGYGYSTNWDKRVYITVGDEYKMKTIGYDDGSYWDHMGIVSDFDISW